MNDEAHKPPASAIALEIHFVDSITSIGKNGWNRVAGTDNPFTRYEFLHALEQTGCTTRATGWAPYHVVVYQAGNTETPLAVMPLYLKTNSYGEYVFDWSWASAYQSNGLQYYPKFVTAVPFTPSVGVRLFVENESLRPQITQLIRDNVLEQAKNLGASSWHVLFPTAEEHKSLDRLGIHSRIATQFRWFNKDYKNFDDFLAALTSRKRKSLRKERQHVKNQGISFNITEGANIDEQQWQNFYLFYQSTYAMRGMQGYLKQSFFETLSESMPEQLLMINALQDGREIAAALFFKNSETLYGRYWGSAQDYQFLHFETCYYQGQDYCIAHGLKAFDSGAQGEHKIQRGFEPIITYSNHWIAHPGFADAINNFLEEERVQIEGYMEGASSLLPYKQEKHGT